MEAQIKLGRVFGVEIGLRYSWLIIALLIMLSLARYFHAANLDWGRGNIWALAIVTAALFFAAVIAHELSQAVVARSLRCGSTSRMCIGRARTANALTP